MADIANVGFSEKENIVAVRTRNDDREVHGVDGVGARRHGPARVASHDHDAGISGAQALRLKSFARTCKAIAPRAPVTPAIIGMNVAVFRHHAGRWRRPVA